MQVTYTAAALKSLRKMQTKDALAMQAKIARFAETGEGDVKKLVGQPFHRLRHGDWRAMLEVKDGVLVVRVAHRREVYE